MAEPHSLQQMTGAEVFEARIQKTSITTIPKIILNNEKSVRGGDCCDSYGEKRVEETR